MKIVLILLLPFLVYASKILSYNVYDRTDRVDVMITFDTPYKGSIKQSSKDSKIIIKLENAQIESSKIKKLSSKFLTYLNITPISNYTQIIASVGESVNFIASKTTDEYGLRLRFKSKNSYKNIYNKSRSSTKYTHNTLPTKKDTTELSMSYYIVVALLIIGIIILFMLKKKINSKKQKKEEDSWLFSKNKEQNITSQEIKSTNEITIQFRKDLDTKNSVIMLNFGEQSYLILMGTNNLLLDKFIDNKPSTQEDFEEILKARHQELDDFLRVGKKEDLPENDALQAYKEKAASIVYTQND